MEIEQVDGGQSGASEGQALSVEQLMEQITMLKKTNERLIDEHRKTKENNRNLRELADKIEKEKVEKDGDLAKQLEYKDKKLSDLEKEYQSMRQKTLKANIVNVMQKVAKDVYDIEDLLNQPKFSHILKEGIDEETLSLRDEAAELYYREVTSAKPWFKQTGKSIGAVTTKPSFISEKSQDFREIKDPGELEKLIKEKFGKNKE